MTTTINYRAHHALMTRLIADAILRGEIQERQTDAGVFAPPETLTDHFTFGTIQRATGWKHFGGNGTDKSPVRRPLFLDYDFHDCSTWRLEGIGLTPVAVEWLIAQRYLPTEFARVFGHAEVKPGDIWGDPLFKTWLANFWIKPSVEGFQYPEPKPERDSRPVKATTVTDIVDRLAYSAAERDEAFARIDALPISKGSKAAHKAHVSRRTVATDDMEEAA